MNINDLINYLNEFKKKIKLYACIDSLKHLYYGGRISRFTTSIGSFINIKPNNIMLFQIKKYYIMFIY